MGNMFQCKIDEIFNDMQNIFGIADNILVIGHDNDGTDHNETVCKVVKRCKDINLGLNQEVSFPMHIHSILQRSDLKKRCTTRPTKN